MWERDAPATAGEARATFKELMKEGLLKSELTVLQYGMYAGTMTAWQNSR